MFVPQPDLPLGFLLSIDRTVEWNGIWNIEWNGIWNMEWNNMEDGMEYGIWNGIWTGHGMDILISYHDII